MSNEKNTNPDLPDDFNAALQLVVGAAMKVGGCNAAAEEGLFDNDDAAETAYSNLANFMAAFNAKFNPNANNL